MAGGQPGRRLERRSPPAAPLRRRQHLCRRRQGRWHHAPTARLGRLASLSNDGPPVLTNVGPPCSVCPTVSRPAVLVRGAVWTGGLRWNCRAAAPRVRVRHRHGEGCGAEVRRASPDGPSGGRERGTAGAWLQGAGEARPGPGRGVHHAGAAQAAPHGASGPSAGPGRAAGMCGRGVDGAQPRPSAATCWRGSPDLRAAVLCLGLGGSGRLVRGGGRSRRRPGQAVGVLHAQHGERGGLSPGLPACHAAGVPPCPRACPGLVRRCVPGPALRQPDQRGAPGAARSSARRDGAVRGLPLALAVRGPVLHAGGGAREGRRRRRDRLLPPQSLGASAGGKRSRRAQRHAARRLPGERAASDRWSGALRRRGPGDRTGPPPAAARGRVRPGRGVVPAGQPQRLRHGSGQCLFGAAATRHQGTGQPARGASRGLARRGPCRAA